MKIKFTTPCTCMKVNKYAAIPEVTWREDSNTISERFADFYMVCRVCTKRWKEEVITDDDPEASLFDPAIPS